MDGGNVAPKGKKKTQNKTEYKRERERGRKEKTDINQGKEVSPHQHRATPLCHP